MTEETPRPRPAPRGDLHTRFAMVPETATLFARRAARFDACAEGHELAPYLRFMAGVARVQAALLPRLPPLPPLPADHAARSIAHGMPPIDRARLVDDPALAETIARFVADVAAVAMPAPAAAALAHLRADPAAQRQHLANALEDAAAADAVAEHVFIAAALQVHAARLAAQLNADALTPVGTGVCPACGGAPVASVLIDRPGTRYCVCATCATNWNMVRVTCVLCGGTEGITYHHLEGRDDGISAEACNACHGYVKLLSQAEHPELDPVADDVASLGLDLKLQDAGWRRGAVNPFLTGY
jgi:FdhE protein